MKKTYRVRVSSTLTAIVGPCHPWELRDTLASWGYVRPISDGQWWGEYTVDVSELWS